VSSSYTTISKEKMESIINADCHDPFSILGMHPWEKEKGVCVRAFIPTAKKVFSSPLFQEHKWTS